MPPRLAGLEEIFGEALDLSPPLRAAFLDRVCDGRAQLRKEVEALVTAQEDEWIDGQVRCERLFGHKLLFQERPRLLDFPDPAKAP